MMLLPACRCSSRALTSQNVEKTLVANVRSICPGGKSAREPAAIWYAALATRTSTAPNAPTARRATSVLASSDRRSASKTWHARPARVTCECVSAASSASSGRCVIAMSAPSLAKAIAVARPIPESPPVISARLPTNLSRPM